jgi:hypothetical protein
MSNARFGLRVRSGSVGGIIEGSSASDLLLNLYPSAATAYSLRLLRGDYSGNAIRVRRSTDDTELDIGFLGSELDVTTLQSFVGVGDGFISTWYDQSGNGRDLSQITLINQPQIVSSGTTITEGGKLAISYNQDWLDANYLMNDDSNYIILFVLRINTVTGTNPRYLSLVSSTVNLQIGYTSSSTYFTRKDNVTNVTTTTFVDLIGTQHLLTHGASNNINYFARNGISYTFSNTTGTPGANSLRPNGLHPLNGYDGSTFYVTQGTMQELIIYETDQFSNLDAIENNINNYYNIY